MPKIKRSELETAEKKYRAYLDERDKPNEQARAIVEEKRALYDAKNKLLDDMRDVKIAKEKLAATLRGHKEKRNELQRKAKELIGQKRKMSKGMKGHIFDDLGGLEREMESLEMKQQTSILTLEEENKLIAVIRKKFSDIGLLKKEAQKQQTVAKDVRGVDESIDSLFKNADEEHENVLKLAAQIKEMQDSVVNNINELSHIINEIRKKQEAIEKIRVQADEYHQKAVAMREKVVATKKEKWKEIQEGRQVLSEHHRKVRQALDDEKKLNEVADEAVKNLFKNGKIELIN